MRRWSECFVPTLREAPLEAETPNHKLLLRAGYVRQHGAAQFSYLFLGRRSMVKLGGIVREEMDRIGQEVSLPSSGLNELVQVSTDRQTAAEVLSRSEGWAEKKTIIERSEDEIVADIARRDLRSYRQLPQIWYEIDRRLHDEPRPRLGLLGTRDPTVCDSRRTTESP